MGNFINYLERKFGKYAIPRLPLIMIICYGVGYMMQMINPQIAYSISLNPYAILRGQVWRLFTWVLIPPNDGNVFLLLISLYFYYSIGTTLERMWGTFYFNYYIFSGMLFTIVASFIVLAIVGFIAPNMLIDDVAAVYGYNNFFRIVSILFFSTYYINMSIFLAFAAMFPDAQVYFMFILPIKVKVLGIIYVVLIVYDAVSRFSGNIIMTGIQLIVIIASLLNFIIFFFTTRKVFGRISIARKVAQRKAAEEYRRKVNSMRPASKVNKHKCAVCGRTDDSNPELEFRFCSKCEGNYEYCQDHLFKHNHIKKDLQPDNNY